LELSCSGDWDSWIAFFAEGVAASATQSQKKVERLVGLQVELRQRVQTAGKRGVAERLAADLIGRPYIDRRLVRQTYEVSGQGAANAISTLVDLGILEPAFVASRGQVFVAREVADAIAE
jgi:Fic family protein